MNCEWRPRRWEEYDLHSNPGVSCTLCAHRGLKKVIDEISSSADVSAILQVGKMYYSQYIRVCTFAPLSNSTHLVCRLTWSTQSEPVRVEHQYPPIMLLPGLIQWMIWSMIPWWWGLLNTMLMPKRNVDLHLFPQIFAHLYCSGPYPRWVSLWSD